MNDTLPLELVRCRAWFETRGALRIADYPGSAWRGALGHALKDTACTRPGTRCAACPERGECPYPPLFDSADGGDPFRPYVLEPQAFSGYFPAGSPLALDLILFGWLVGWLPLIADALQRLGERGLGMREPVRLTLIDLQQQTGTDGATWVSLAAPAAVGLPTAPLAPLGLPPAPPRARMDLITPLKIKYRGALIKPETFGPRDLLTALARRIEACAGVLETLPLTPEPGLWLDSADDLIERADLHWLDTHHRSSRQREDLKLGGLVGRLLLRGPVLERCWPWLWLGQWLHLGSSTTIGFGRYDLEPLSAVGPASSRPAPPRAPKQTV
jgi:hypothetical protein